MSRIGLGLLVILTAASVDGGSLVCRQIDIAGAKSTAAMAINERGDIGGQFTDAQNVTHGFLMDRHGDISIIDVPGSARTTVVGMNAEGDMVGRADIGGIAHGYVLSRGTYTLLRYSGATFTNAQGINARGDVVGRYQNGTVDHAYTFVDGLYSNVDVSGAAASQAAGIDDAGDFVGSYTSADGKQHGFVRSGGTVMTIDFPGATGTILRGIARGGQLIVGTAFGNPMRGILLEGDVWSTYEFPGAAATTIFAVNSAGEFVGQFGASATSTAVHGYACTDRNDRVHDARTRRVY